MRDGINGSPPLRRLLQFGMNKLMGHGWFVFLVYVAVVHFRLHSVISIVLEEVGLGFVNDFLEKFIGSSDEPSLEDVPDLIDEDGEEGESGESGESGGDPAVSGLITELEKTKKRKKEKKIKVKTPLRKRKKPDTWLTYDKNLGVIPLGVARQWHKDEKRRQEDVVVKSVRESALPPVRNGHELMDCVE